MAFGTVSFNFMDADSYRRELYHRFRLDLYHFDGIYHTCLF